MFVKSENPVTGLDLFESFCRMPLFKFEPKNETSSPLFPLDSQDIDSFQAMIPSYLGADSVGDYPLGYDVLFYLCAKRACVVR